jgi:SAM-dependent methyltransferase
MLAAEGHQAVGIDSSEGMIAAAKENHPGEFYPYGFSEIDQLEGRFDIIYCVGNSLSYLPNDQLDEFMGDVTRLLEDGGTFLVQVVNWDRFLGMGRIDFDVKALSEGRSFHRRYEPREDGTVIFHTAVRKDGEVLGSWADVLYPKTAELLAGAAEGAGLIVSGVYGDYSEAAFDSNSSPALILTARN